MRLKMLTLSVASKIIAGVLQKGAELGLNPLTVTVLDSRHSAAMLSQDGSSPLRHKIAHGRHSERWGSASAPGRFSSARRSSLLRGAVATAADGALIPVPGGVLIRSSDGAVLGAVGVTGDSSDNDEVAAIYGIEQAGLVADAG
jgi:uncharacterized protein GlcG (DUF336 family)